MGEDFIDGIDPSNMDPGEDSVALSLNQETGHAGVLPGAAKRYPSEIRGRLIELQRASMEIARLRDFIDEEAPLLRSYGVSWNVLGFVCMIDPTSAQRRWSASE